jgi:hypothetical protein
LYLILYFLEARIPPQTPPARGNPKRNPAEFQKISSRGFANPPPAKLLRKTESAVYLAFSRTSVFAEAPRFAWWRASARGTLGIFFEKSSRK